MSPQHFDLKRHSPNAITTSIITPAIDIQMTAFLVKSFPDPGDIAVSGEDAVQLTVLGDGGGITGADEGGEVGGGGRIVVLNGFPSFLQSRF